jgi:hypothetical protein
MLTLAIVLTALAVPAALAVPPNCPPGTTANKYVACTDGLKARTARRSAKEFPKHLEVESYSLGSGQAGPARKRRTK